MESKVNIFNELNYKKTIFSFIENSKHIAGYKTRLAEAAGCQKSFLSQVLNSHVHLTLEHAVGLCEFWNFSESETEYYLTLVQYERSSSKKLTDTLKNRLKKIRNENLKVENILPKMEQIEQISAQEFFSNWMAQLICVLINIPNLNNIDALSKKFAVSKDQIRQQIKTLENMNLVSQKQGLLYLKTNHFFNNHDSLGTRMMHMIWRQKASLLLDLKNVDHLHFTTLYGISVKDAAKIRQEITKMLQNVQKIVLPSQEEEVFCLAIDFYNPL